MNDDPYGFLNAEPAAPAELHALLKYLSDAFALLEDWIREPARTDRGILQMKTSAVEATSPQAKGNRTYAAGRSHLSAEDGSRQIRLHHPTDTQGRPGYAETYNRSANGAAELLYDIGLQAVERVEARSQWNSWDGTAQPPEEIRLALRETPGYYVQCPLDSDGNPLHVVARLEFVLDDEDPDGARTREIPVNPETRRLLELLATCVRPLKR